jgi:hypothetical protein
VSIISVDLAAREAERTRGRSSIQWIGIVAAFVVAVGIVVFFLHATTRMNVKDLFVDPAAKAQLGSHVGVFSHLGVLALWTGATALVGSVLVAASPNGSRVLLALGGLLAWMAIDDLYLVHEELGGVISRYLLPAVDRRLLEGIIFAVTGVAWIAWLARSRDMLRRDPGVLLLIGALALLGASLTIDVGEILVEEWVRVSEGRMTAVAVIEELLKLGGILLLSVYAMSLARHHVRPEARWN